MREFFKGWKRKAGCVTLLVACVFMVGWVRSELVSDIVMYDLNVNDDQWGAVKSYRQRVSWNHIYGDPDNIEESCGFQYWSYPIRVVDQELQGPGDYNDLCRIEWFGFELRVFPRTYGALHPPVEVSAAVPYWSIVIPLTLFSACLLLSQPRRAKN